MISNLENYKSILSESDRILFISGREKSYIRNESIIEVLTACNNNVKVIESEEKNLIKRHIILIKEFVKEYKKTDLLFIGFLSQYLVILLSPYIFLKGGVITFADFYLSTFDTLLEDKDKFQQLGSIGILGNILFWLVIPVSYVIDFVAIRFAKYSLIDTYAHKEYISELLRFNKNRILVRHIGVPKSLTDLAQKVNIKPENKRIFMATTFMKIIGFEVVIKAAKLLPEFQFVIGGDGKGKSKYEKMAIDENIKNIHFLGWVSYEDYLKEVARAKICLGGHFSNIPKATRVISTKTFLYLYMNKPTIVSNNLANRELVDKNLYFTNNTGEDLHDTILQAYNETKRDNK